ncbi:serine hydrolase domain-containing protein [Streptomyces sp. NPDC005827]|uniref:serine hydrolase domain-containing protein n=1 Tax=Streptomyces sp. NPDC005827 TaxID=3157070 RepID=UPI0033C16081
MSTDAPRAAGHAATAADAVQGFVAPGFEAVSRQLAQLVAENADYSAQFCAYADGRTVVDIWSGPDAEENSVQGIFSATKGVVGVCAALLIERGLLDPDKEMSHYWPEFAQGGKGSVTVRTALSHRAGIPGVEPQVTHDQLMDHGYMAARLAAQTPHWHPGAAHGYHGLTIGTLVDELVRRIDGRTLDRFYREEIGVPRDIDVFIATPEDQEPRVRDVLPQQPTAEQAAAMQGSPLRQSGDTLPGMAFNLAVNDPLAELMPNVRRYRAAGQPSAGGVGSARGLARLYASLISEVDGMPRLLSSETVATVSQLHSVGLDMVLCLPTRFGIVFQKPDPTRMLCGSHQSFGHDGAGGAIGIADPWHSLGWGYVPRRMSTPGGADERGLALAGTLRQCLAEQRACPPSPRTRQPSAPGT